MLAYTASTWTAVIVASSIFGPLLIAIALAWVFVKSWRHGDPDHERLKRAQAEYEAQRDRPARPRR